VVIADGNAKAAAFTSFRINYNFSTHPVLIMRKDNEAILTSLRRDVKLKKADIKAKTTCVGWFLTNLQLLRRMFLF